MVLRLTSKFTMRSNAHTNVALSNVTSNFQLGLICSSRVKMQQKYKKNMVSPRTRRRRLRRRNLSQFCIRKTNGMIKISLGRNTNLSQASEDQ